MKLDPDVIAELTIPFRPKAYLRVMPKVYASTPLGMGFGQTRFSAPDNSFQLVYIARDVATVVAETVIRDRFEGRARRVLDITELDDWAISEASAPVPLTVLDLRTTGLLKLGVSTNAARAKKPRCGPAAEHAAASRGDGGGGYRRRPFPSPSCIEIRW